MADRTYNDYPQSATNNAKKALKIRGEGVITCGTPVGWSRANQLAKREPISRDVVSRMAQFNRHKQNSEGNPREKCGPLMWLAWGGTSGINWAISKMDQIKKEEKVKNEVTIQGYIDSMVQSMVLEKINMIPEDEDMTIIIDSAGGDVFAGQSIASLIKARGGETTIIGRGLVASIATIIMLSGDNVYMDEDAMMMIHNAWSLENGRAKEMRKKADLLDKVDENMSIVYLRKIKCNNKLVEDSEKKTMDLIKGFMDEEKWMTAQEAYEYGFVDKVIKTEYKQDSKAKAENYKRLKLYAKTPKYLLNNYNINKDMEDEKVTKNFLQKLAEALGIYSKSECAKAELLEEKTVKNEYEEKAEGDHGKPKAMEIEEIIEMLKEAGYKVEKIEEIKEEEKIEEVEDKAKKEAEMKLKQMEEHKKKMEEDKKKMEAEMESLKKIAMKAEAKQLGGSEMKFKPKSSYDQLLEDAANKFSIAFDKIREQN